ncbi:hypothetical protein [Dyella koreensis]|uniref:ABC transporter permease n=1 Tax=Dyella koreensis TaxID=311235 RepID=A0ABW8K651_9GAMM
MHELLSYASDAVRYVLRGIFWDVVLFQLGRAALLFFTLGRYPRGSKLDEHSDRIAGMGLFVLALIWATIALYNYRLPGLHSA